MEYINGRCHTNLDDYDCSLVTKFVAVPRKGEKVKVILKGKTVSLYVTMITHTILNNEPFIIIELTNTPS